MIVIHLDGRGCFKVFRRSRGMYSQSDSGIKGTCELPESRTLAADSSDGGGIRVRLAVCIWSDSRNGGGRRRSPSDLDAKKKKRRRRKEKKRNRGEKVK